MRAVQVLTLPLLIDRLDQAGRGKVRAARGVGSHSVLPYYGHERDSTRYPACAAVWGSATVKMTDFEEPLSDEEKVKKHKLSSFLLADQDSTPAFLYISALRVQTNEERASEGARGSVAG